MFPNLWGTSCPKHACSWSATVRGMLVWCAVYGKGTATTAGPLLASVAFLLACTFPVLVISSAPAVYTLCELRSYLSTMSSALEVGQLGAEHRLAALGKASGYDRLKRGKDCQDVE